MIQFLKISNLVLIIFFLPNCEKKFDFKIKQGVYESNTNQEIPEGEIEKYSDQSISKVQNINDENISGPKVEDEDDQTKEELSEIEQNYDGQNPQIISNSDNKNNDGSRYTNYMVIASILLLLITLASVSISFYLYRWRVAVSEKLQIMVPESFHSTMQGLMKSTNANTQYLDQHIRSFKESIKISTERMDEMIESYLLMRDKLDAKDAEIKRLKEGYDTTIFKSFLIRFLRVNTALIKIKNEANDKDVFSVDDIEYLVDVFEDALIECGVSQFIPDLGADYKKIDGISQNPKTEETHDKNKEFTISEVIEPGYKIDSSGETVIIKPAKVKIFVPKK